MIQENKYRRDVILRQPWFNNIEFDKRQVFEKLLVKDPIIANQVKSLLVIPHEDCLTNIDNYKNDLKTYNLRKLKEDKYITLVPRITPNFNSEVQCFIIVTSNYITPTDNPCFYSYVLNVYCMCQFDAWNLDNFQERPLKLAGIVNGLLDNEKLSNIGRLEWKNTTMLTVDSNVGGYVSSFLLIQGEDDVLVKD